jgi:ice-binding like protein
MMKGFTGLRAIRAAVPTARTARVIVAIGFAGLAASACDVHGISNPGTVSSISVSPNPKTIAANGTQQFTAVGTDFSGATVAIQPTWSVVTGGGTISSTGVFTAASTPGTFTNTVMATSGNMTSTATVIVTTGSLATIVVSPNPQSLVVGGTQQYTAVGQDSSGNAVAVTPVWSVVAGGGAISTAGVFTAGNAPGTYTNTIKATSGGISATASVTVTATPPAPPPLTTIVVTPNPDTTQTGATQQFAAVGRDGNGNTVAITPVWTVVNGGGSIDATGRFTAGSVTGTYTNTVKASSGTVSGSATVVVLVTVPPPSPLLINLGAAAPNGIMAGTAVTCVTGGTINADVSVSPGNTITGFGPCVITGVQHLADAVAAQAQIDLTRAYNTLAALPCPPANAIVANLGGTTKAAGVYCTASGIGVTGVLTLDGGGDPNATFVFQAGSGLTTAGDVVLINGAQARNVYWQVGTSATIGTASKWKGNILAYTSITLVDNATLLGRALARNGAVSLGTNNVITLP